MPLTACVCVCVCVCVWFCSKVLPEQPSADSEAEHDGAWSGDISALPPAVNAWEV